MKFELTLGVYKCGVLVDTVCYVVPGEPLARFLALLPEDFDGVSVCLEGVKELAE